LLLTIRKSNWTLVYNLRRKVVRGIGCENASSTVILGLKFIDIYVQYECEKKIVSSFHQDIFYTFLDRIAQIVLYL